MKAKEIWWRGRASRVTFQHDERDRSRDRTYLSNVGAIVKIQVACYSGHKSDERPIKFSLGNTVLFVDSIQDQWYGPDDLYFRVLADDGNTYVIRHNEKTDEWTLASFRAQTASLHVDSNSVPPAKIH